MNSPVKKIILLQSLFLIGCGAQNLVIDTIIPTPLVSKNENITATLMFDEKLQNFIFIPEELQKKEASVQISFGDTQVKLFQNIFSSFFVFDKNSAAAAISILRSSSAFTIPSKCLITATGLSLREDFEKSSMILATR